MRSGLRPDRASALWTLHLGDAWGRTRAMELQGFTAHAEAALKDDELSSSEKKFLEDHFGPARDRMSGLAATVGTAGTVLVALVALMVGFAGGRSEASDKLLAASQAAALAQQGCSDKVTSTVCDQAKLMQANEKVESAKRRAADVDDFGKYQAAAGFLSLIGFLFGLGAQLTVPVPGPKTSGDGKVRNDAWRAAVNRLKQKRNLICVSLAFQLSGIICIGVLVVKIF